MGGDWARGEEGLLGRQLGIIPLPPFPVGPIIFTIFIIFVTFSIFSSSPLDADPKRGDRSSSSSGGGSISAYEVIKRGEERMRGNSSYARIKFTIEKRRFRRSMLIDIWETRRADRSFIRLLKPKKDQGVSFLKRSQNLWQYIPKIGKEIKIEESLLGESWMGSDFSNDDLVKSSSIVDDYSHTFAPKGDKGNREDKEDKEGSSSQKERLYRILLTPKPGRPVVWEKIIIYSRKQDYLPEQQEFFDHKERLKKRMTLSRFQTLGGRLIPTRLEMASIKDGKPQSRTIMDYQKARFNLKIAASLFTKANLRR